MEFLQILILAVVQGLTEFLPVSSSAHLVLVPWLTDWQDQGLAFDVAVHFGTLIAVVVYFRQEVKNVTVACIGSVTGAGMSTDARLGWMIAVATLPAIFTGLFLSGGVETYARSPKVIAFTTIIFGALLLLADRLGKQTRNEQSLSFTDALIIGVAQAIALIPGTSRSGITITAALALGLSRQAAARFSFLMSIPTITCALLYLLLKMYKNSVPIEWLSMLLGAVLAAISAYFCIHFFIRLLERLGMLPFVIYRFLLGGILLFLVY